MQILRVLSWLLPACPLLKIIQMICFWNFCIFYCNFSFLKQLVFFLKFSDGLVNKQDGMRYVFEEKVNLEVMRHIYYFEHLCFCLCVSDQNNPTASSAIDTEIQISSSAYKESKCILPLFLLFNFWMINFERIHEAKFGVYFPSRLLDSTLLSKSVQIPTILLFLMLNFLIWNIL